VAIRICRGSPVIPVSPIQTGTGVCSIKVCIIQIGLIQPL
jgi:hypothetical protein